MSPRPCLVKEDPLVSATVRAYASCVKKRLLALSLLGFAIAAAVPASASHSWSTYHWGRTANPFTLRLGDNVSGVWDGHLTTTSADWSQSSALDTTIVAGGTKARQCKPTAGRVEVCNAAYGKNGWLGLAQIWLSGGHIVQGVAKLNDSYFNAAPYNDANARLHVMCQEIGHTFGLDHQPAGSDSCMNDRDRLLDAAASHPNAHDTDQLATIYGHLDGTSTVSRANGAKGSESVTVTTRGRFQVVTFVFPA